MLRPMRYLLVPLVLMTASVGCEKRLDSFPAPPEASAPVPAAVTWHLSVEPTSTMHIDMSGASQRIVGDTTAAMGSLDVVPTDLSKSRGAVMIDLASFATHTFGNGDDAKQTKDAAAWLEAAGAADNSFRWASFAIRSIDGMATSDLTKVVPVKDGKDDVRTVTMTLHGDLLIHGHKEQRDAKVDVSFRYAGDAAADSRPTRVDVASKEPFKIVLADIDVRPRDAATGAIVPWTAKWKTAVAPSADVTVKLSAIPSS